MDKHLFFKIADIEKNEKVNVSLSRPRIVRLYEYNHGRLRPSKRLNYLKDLKHVDYPLDLDNQENLKFVEPKQRHTHIYTPLSSAISMAIEPFATANDGVELTRVYAPRRVLTTIMESSMSARHNFYVQVAHYNGSIYMAGLQNGLPLQKQAHHLNLEKVLFSGSPQAPIKNKRFSDRNFSLSALHATTLGKYGLIYTGGVQGVIADEEFHKFDDLEALNQLRFVHAKQIRKKAARHEWKMLRYWTQAKLVNVDDIYFAYKNSEGIVESPLEHIQISNIPESCTSWKPQNCIGVLHEFLEKAEQLMENVNSLDTVYTFYFKGKERAFYYEVKSNKSFIPKFYPNLN